LFGLTHETHVPVVTSVSLSAVVQTFPRSAGLRPLGGNGGNPFRPYGRTFANGEITHYLRDHGYAIKVPPTWRDLFASGQKLLRQGVEAAEVPGRLGIRAERWQEICGACSVRVVALGVEALGDLDKCGE